MIIQLIPCLSAQKPICEAKIVLMNARLEKKQKIRQKICSQLYSLKNSLCTVAPTNLWVIYRNNNLMCGYENS
jgi:hypothetical protein